MWTCLLALALCAPFLALGLLFAPMTFRWLAADLPNNELAGLGFFLGIIGLAALAVSAVTIPFAAYVLRKELKFPPEPPAGPGPAAGPAEAHGKRAWPARYFVLLAVTALLLLFWARTARFQWWSWSFGRKVERFAGPKGGSRSFCGSLRRGADIRQLVAGAASSIDEWPSDRPWPVRRCEAETMDFDAGSAVLKLDIAAGDSRYKGFAETDFAGAVKAIELYRVSASSAGAASALEASALSGDPQAQYRLAASMDEAVRHWDAAPWLARAAWQGHVDAMHKLAALKAAGKGVPKDLVGAYALCVTASQNGSNEAAIMMGELRRLMNEAEFDKASKRSQRLLAAGVGSGPRLRATPQGSDAEAARVALRVEVHRASATLAGLLAVLSSPGTMTDHQVAETVSKRLGAMGPSAKAAVPGLSRIVREGRYTGEPSIGGTKRAAVKALRSIGPDSVEALSAVLADPAFAGPDVYGPAMGVRREAVEALGSMGPAASAGVPALDRLLGECLSEKDPLRARGLQPMCVAALMALARIGPAAVPALMRALEGPDEALAFGAIQALGSMGEGGRRALAGAPIQAPRLRALAEAAAKRPSRKPRSGP